MLQLSKDLALLATRGHECSPSVLQSYLETSFKSRGLLWYISHRLHSAISISHAHKTFKQTSKVPHSEKLWCISQYLTKCKVSRSASSRRCNWQTITCDPGIFNPGCHNILKKPQRKTTSDIRLKICLKISNMSCNHIYAQARFLLQVCYFCHGPGSENTQAQAAPRHISQTLASWREI